MKQENKILFIVDLLNGINEEDMIKGSDLMMGNWDHEEFHVEHLEECSILAYAHRWFVRRQSLPVVVRARMVRWIRGDKLRREAFELLAEAIEKNDRSMLEIKTKGDEIEI